MSEIKYNNSKPKKRWTIPKLFVMGFDKTKGSNPEGTSHDGTYFAS